MFQGPSELAANVPSGDVDQGQQGLEEVKGFNGLKGITIIQVRKIEIITVM